MHEFADLRLFITGPTYLRPEVKAAGLLPEFGHRDNENSKRFLDIFRDLGIIADLPEDYETILIPGSGSNGMEAAIRSVVADDKLVLHVSCGAFGDLWHKMSVMNGKNAELLSFEPGTAIDMAVLEDVLAKKQPSVVVLTHNETSTGVLNDIYTATKLCKQHGALVLVDGVSIFGGAPTESNAGWDIYCAATQKCLGLPAGFGIVFMSPEAIDKAKYVKNRGYVTDLLAHLPRAQKLQTLSTPNTTLANQMFAQLEYIVKEETTRDRFDRHYFMQHIVRQWTLGLPAGYQPFVLGKHRSPSVSTILCPPDITIEDLKRIKEAMRMRAFLFDPGYGKLNEQRTKQGLPLVFRIGHMGDITTQMLQDYLDILGGVLRL